MFTNSFAGELEKYADQQGILLVHDKLPEADEKKILAKFPPGSVRLVGALWFYLSVYYNIELPMTCFEPATQRETLAQEETLQL